MNFHYLILHNNTQIWEDVFQHQQLAVYKVWKEVTAYLRFQRQISMVVHVDLREDEGDRYLLLLFFPALYVRLIVNGDAHGDVLRHPGLSG